MNDRDETAPATGADLAAIAQRLNASTEALAVLGAALRARVDGLEIPDGVAGPMQEVLDELGVGPLGPADVAEIAPVLGMIRAFFVQAGDLLACPDRPPGWANDDPALLIPQGRASMLVPPLLDQAPEAHDARAAWDAPGGRFLDIGTGVGLLAVALCQRFADLRVVGIDPWPPALALAAEQVANHGMGHRIELREASATDLDDVDTYDGVWIPGPFLAPDIVHEVLGRAHTAMRSGGWVVFGLYASAPDPLARALNDLRVIRSGGHPWTPDEAAALLADAGFTDIRPVQRTWAAPIGFVLACR